MRTRTRIALISLIAVLGAGPVALRAAQPGSPAPGGAGWRDVVLPTPDGRPVALGDHIGRTPVLLAFWATWCPNCDESVGVLNGIESGPLARRVKVLAIDYLERPGKVGAFVRKKKVAYTVVLDRDGAVSRRFGILGVPTYILLDREGRVAWRSHALPDDVAGILP